MSWVQVNTEAALKNAIVHFVCTVLGYEPMV